jgi:predicted Rossmann-fold nucleotide-binding protein
MTANPRLITYKHFFTHKVAFVKEADAIAIFPGGFGTMDEAMEVFTLAARLYPRSARSLDLLGQAWAAQGQIEDAVACLEKALALDPGNKALAARLERAKASLREAK